MGCKAWLWGNLQVGVKFGILPVIPDEMDNDIIALNSVKQADPSSDTQSADRFKSRSLSDFRVFLKHFQFPIEFIQKSIDFIWREIFKQVAFDLQDLLACSSFPDYGFFHVRNPLNTSSLERVSLRLSSSSAASSAERAS